jgi:hypothetical protein
VESLTKAARFRPERRRKSKGDRSVADDAVTLYNLALDTIGARANISLPTEQSREAEACNRWFPNIRDQVLASAPWPEATKMDRLATLSVQDGDTWLQGEPRPDLLNAYGFPVDCLRPQYLSDFSKFTVQSYGAENKAIMSNASSPILVYTFRQTLVGLWGAELQMAIMYGLAASICPGLTGKTSRIKLLIEQANQRILAARQSAANMDDERLESTPDWIAARGYGGGSSLSRFVYPFGSLLTSNVS